MSDSPVPLAPGDLVGAITTGASRISADMRGALTGRVSSTASISADISGGISGALVGRISSITIVWGEATPQKLLELENSIIVSNTVSSGFIIETLTARVTTTTSSTGSLGSGLAVLTGNIKSATIGTALVTQTIFSGRIGTTTTALVNFRDPQVFVGNILSRTEALLVSIPLFNLPVVNIVTKSSATLDPARILIADVRSTTQARLDVPEFKVFFEGEIRTTVTAVLTPAVDILAGHISTAAWMGLPPLPILPQVEPPYCPAPAILDDYLDLITSEHRPRPNYIASVTASVNPLIDDQAVAASMPCLFDLDISVGEQEDFVGQWIGKTRYVHLGNVFFSFDTKGLGWDEANWRGPYDPESAIATLDDYHYRLLLYAAIVANSWDGSIPEAYRAWDTLFAGTGYRVLIQDNGNMTMLLGIMGTGSIDAVTAALFQGGDMDLKPEGISLIDYVFQAQPNVPFFAWDSVSDSVAGWDLGYWGYLVPPGQGFVPEAARMRG